MPIERIVIYYLVMIMCLLRGVPSIANVAMATHSSSFYHYYQSQQQQRESIVNESIHPQQSTTKKPKAKCIYTFATIAYKWGRETI